MSVGSQRTPGPTPNMDEIDLEEQYGIQIEIERYRFNNLDTKVRIRNDVTIHYAGYFIKSSNEARAILESCKVDKFVDSSPVSSPLSSPAKSTSPHKVTPKKYRARPADPDIDPVPLWRTDSVISLLEKEHGLNHFCSTWPQHGDKVLSGPITFTLGDERSPLAPSLVLAIKEMRVGEIRVVYVPPAEVYGLDMTAIKRRLPLKEWQGVKERDTTAEGELMGEEEQTRVKKGKADPYYSSSSDDEFDPDEEILEPWCDAPGTRGDRSTFFRPLTPPQQQQQQKQQQQKTEELEVHRGLTGLLYVVQLLDFGESQPEGEIIHVKQPLETEKKPDKPEGGNVDT
eukprot:TRINITY_DN638_c0_g1_i1.p1 TRINITY_DN638_c0_g1~~TRINITY_DN638_c0_g1_i1.p1  ORF type:complete len:342 (+),score=94.08 TRINITY_DN638_c0_g1_i1:1017-2042(+)